MSRKISLSILFLVSGFAHVFAQNLPDYKNPKLSVGQRTQDLINRMTIDEKVGQLLCPMGWEMYEKNGNEVAISATFKNLIDTKHIGMFWGVYRADPWTKKTLENGLNPELAAKAGNALQKYVMENTRLGIPLFLAEESPHGHMAIGTTVFPTGIGLASSWNPDLVEKVSAAMAKELRLQGGHISYGPVMDLSREPRWSRVEESFGEDPVLTAAIGVAVVKGGGAGNLGNPFGVVSTLKHFIAYGIPEGGHNGNPSVIGQRELTQVFLPPFEAAVKAGALSIMTAYNSIDGIPNTANGHLYNELLKKSWNFRGFVVSDLFSINGLKGSHHVAKDLKEAGEISINAGVDVDLGANGYAALKKSVEEGKVSMATLDAAVARVLKLKFEMGLFDNPYVNPETAKKEVRNTEHIKLAKEVAAESIVLLENKKGILPLSKNLKKIAVIGPNADNMYNQLGDYTAPQEESNIETVLEGIKAKYPKAKVEYVKGCAIRDEKDVNIPAAVKAAHNAEVVIVVVGGSSARDFKTKYIETGAAVTSSAAISDMESGEGYDRASLSLLGKQQKLLEAIKATGKPMIVVYIQGRPLEMNWAAQNANALLCAWYPGQEGGSAIADILTGDVNPSGKMPISVPKNVGQLPVYYNKKTPIGHEYVEMSQLPLYTFGYGLSYTTFLYSDLVINKKGKENFEISCKIKNTGKVAGKEVVQLYLRDEVASVVQPVKQLKYFQKIMLKPGEGKTVIFDIISDDLSLINIDMQKVVEPGAFKVMVGASSVDIRLEGRVVVE